MEKNELNNIYKKLETKSNELSSPFNKIHKVFDYKVAYFSGHYSKNEHGKYEMDYFPIPVISIVNYCDIEIGLNGISLTTKLKRLNALNFDYQKLKDYRFEVYGVTDYLSDYYTEGNTIEDLVKNIQSSQEHEIGFSFKFDEDIQAEDLYRFVLLIRRKGFFYRFNFSLSTQMKLQSNLNRLISVRSTIRIDDYSC